MARPRKKKKIDPEKIYHPSSWNFPAPTGVCEAREVLGHNVEHLRPEDQRPPVNEIYVAPEVHRRLSIIPSVIPPRELHTVNSVRVFGQNGVIIDSQNRVVENLTPDFKPQNVGKYRHRLQRYSGLIPVSKKLKGHGFSFVSAASWKNYFHWLIDTLPTARFIDWDQYDYILAPNCKAFHRFSFETLGIPEEKIIPLDHHSHYEVETLSTIPSGPVALIPDEAIEYLQNLFGAQPEQNPTRRFYLSRNDGWRRRVTNEERIFSLLEPLGFEHIVIGKRTIREQAALFSQASHVVGSHGAGMTNLVFSSPQTKLMECFFGSFMFPHFYHLCASLRQPYLAHWTDAPDESPDNPIEEESFMEKVNLML